MIAVVIVLASVVLVAVALRFDHWVNVTVLSRPTHHGHIHPPGHFCGSNCPASTTYQN